MKDLKRKCFVETQKYEVNILLLLIFTWSNFNISYAKKLLFKVSNFDIIDFLRLIVSSPLKLYNLKIN